MPSPSLRDDPYKRMSFVPAVCPECGGKPDGITQRMMGRSNLSENADGSYEWSGETEAFDDDQEDVKNAAGQVEVLCGNGHEWWATMTKMQNCPNCSDGCKATRPCNGCDMTLCERCWLEHNEDAPDHEEAKEVPA